MGDWTGLGRALVLLGIALMLLGLALAGKLPFLGKLPGDIRIQRDGFVFYFPLTSLLLLSLVISLIASLWRR